MSEKTRIQWTDATWNPVRGCSRVSPGCQHCYAEAVASRFSGPGMPYEGLAADGKWTGVVRLIPEHLADPLRWTKPRRIFVNSMSDLFHEGLKDEEIDRIFAVMGFTPRHTYQILTKRPERMLAWAKRASDPKLHEYFVRLMSYMHPWEWPLPNVWLGVSVEDQKRADERIPVLLRTPAACRFVSAEPLLGPVDLCSCAAHIPGTLGHLPACHLRGLDWIIVGGESGPHARPFHVRWADRIIEDCAAAGVACFMKQLGTDPRWIGAKSDPIAHASGKNDDPSRWPESLRVQQFPASP